jgi:hypothetical protein
MREDDNLMLDAVAHYALAFLLTLLLVSICVTELYIIDNPPMLRKVDFGHVSAPRAPVSQWQRGQRQLYRAKYNLQREHEKNWYDITQCTNHDQKREDSPRIRQSAPPVRRHDIGVCV